LEIYAFLIVLYILALGPLNFMLLRWRRHLEWSWVTVPVVAALFGLGSFGLAYARNGGDVLVHIDTVVYLDPGSPTKLADSYLGVFAPFHGDYDLVDLRPRPGLGPGQRQQRAVLSGRADPARHAHRRGAAVRCSPRRPA